MSSVWQCLRRWFFVCWRRTVRYTVNPPVRRRGRGRASADDNSDSEEEYQPATNANRARSSGGAAAYSEDRVNLIVPEVTARGSNELKKVTMLFHLYNLEYLPTWKLTTPDTDKMTDACSICLDDLESGQEIRMLPCFHEFHKECIDRWLMKAKAGNILCPNCNTSVTDSMEAYRTEIGTAMIPERLVLLRELRTGIPNGVPESCKMFTNGFYLKKKNNKLHVSLNNTNCQSGI